MFKKRPAPSSSTFFDDIPIPVGFDHKPLPDSEIDTVQANTAIIYCEANFGETDGKVATGFIRRSDDYEILAVIDSDQAGRDAGEVLNAEPNGIPILRSLNEALADLDHIPGFFIFGISRASGQHSPAERRLILDAIKHDMKIVNGLQEFANQDPEFATT
ncbi:MAG: DUF1611 domain-containing protein [Akkermansiaceae bacterium]|jgi:uncharacterized NAD-dependent epimerase/dehydratase family protein